MPKAVCNENLNADLAGEAGQKAVAFGSKILIRHQPLRIARELRFEAVEEEHFERPVVLRFDDTSRLEIEE